MSDSFPFVAAMMASMLHVITGPDHLAAVTPFALVAKRKAWKIGLAWGLGHLFGMAIIGILMALFSKVIPIEAISSYSEQIVGLLLLGIGLWVIYRILRPGKAHKHLHVHAGDPNLIHSHPHDHSIKPNHDHSHARLREQGKLAAFGIGVVHGLAGLVHFFLFLPVLSFETWPESIGYIGGFSLGILIAMTAYAIAIGSVAALAKDRHNESFFTGIRLAAGLFAILVGIYWILSF
jgi:ABC-type nickel/cobalt efflux system permease component RcnA